MTECIFCKITKKEAPAKVLAETSDVIAFESIRPVADHHVLIVPKKHINSFLDLEESHKDILIDMAKVAQEVIKKLGISGGYKLCFNGGKYQEVLHIHWHLLGGKLEDRDTLNKT